jgi:predicted enzyme related to lactoylglutathione lyase
MAINAKYVHTNIVAGDWKSLAEFYIQAFDCKPVPPERRLSGAWIDAATGLKRAEIRGIHLRLPGTGNEGPTLEIFQYHPPKARKDNAINGGGLRHLAFAVDDVDSAMKEVLRLGGSQVGEQVSVQIPDAGRIQCVYVRDPEGNIIELQRWL